MGVLNCVPKSLRKFKKSNTHKTKYEQSVVLIHDHPDVREVPGMGVVGRDFIVVSKTKSSIVYHVKISFDNKSDQAASNSDCIHFILNKAAGKIEYATEGAFSGGMLYQIWAARDFSGKPRDPIRIGNKRVEAVIKSMIISADKIASGHGGRS